MKIERYSDAYFLDVVNIIANFHKEAVKEYDSCFEPSVVIQTIKLGDPRNAFLLILDGKCEGLLYGSRFYSYLNQGETFQEIIWYVNKAHRKYGVLLLREVEKILKSEGVSNMIMAVLENSKTEKIKCFYNRLGYKPMETHFVRAL